MKPIDNMCNVRNVEQYLIFFNFAPKRHLSSLCLSLSSLGWLETINHTLTMLTQLLCSLRSGPQQKLHKGGHTATKSPPLPKQ